LIALIRERGLTLCCRPRVNEQQSVRIKLAICHDFMLEFLYSFYFFPNLLFALSRFVFSNIFYVLPSRLFISFTALLFL
jgi:hypothetical protein